MLILFKDTVFRHYVMILMAYLFVSRKVRHEKKIEKEKEHTFLFLQVGHFQILHVKVLTKRVIVYKM